MLAELAPGFLLAAPVLADPNFKRTVVLLVEHRAEGSIGFIVNRAGPSELRSVARELGMKLGDRSPSSPVLVGGPVAPWTGWIVYDPRTISPVHDSVQVTPSIAVSASRDLLQSLALGEGPSRATLVLGYAGWGAGQLDEELKAGVWLPADLDDAIVFETPLESRWTHALEANGIDPARVSSSFAHEA